MKEYKLVYLNKKMRLSLEKDILQAEATLNQWVEDVWELMQIVPYGGFGAIIAVMCRGKEEVSHA